MKVKFLKLGITYGWAYSAGMIADIPKDRAKELIELKVVEEVPEPKQAEVKQAVIKKAKKR